MEFIPKEPIVNPLHIVLNNTPNEFIDVDKHYVGMLLLAFDGSGIKIESSNEFLTILKLLHEEYALVDLRRGNETLQIRKVHYG